MMGENISALHIAIYREVLLPNRQKLILGEPIQSRWEDIEIANHNVFCLDAQNQVVWQVHRVENPDSPSWPEKHAMARQWKSDGLIDGAFTDEGYLDPFTSLSLDERAAIDSEPKGVWRPGCVVYLFTRWWSYVLDPPTGIATCTGDQVK